MNSLHQLSKNDMSDLEDVLKGEFTQTKTDLDAREMFWYIPDAGKNKGRPVIGRHAFIEFLHFNNFVQIRHLNVLQFAHIKRRSIVDIVTNVDIRHYVYGKVRSFGKTLPGASDVYVVQLLEVLMRGANIYFGIDNLSSLNIVEFKALKSSSSFAYFTFKNAIVRVDAKSKKMIDYESIDAHVWSTQLIDREFKELKTQSFMTDFCFYEFMSRISNDDDERLSSLISYLGFMLHDYRDPARPQLLVCYDEQISENPEGGTGKGIMSQALMQLKRGVVIDGKSFDFNDQFCWQRVSFDTQLIVFQDVKKYFKFENLHSVITDGISVNKKRKDEFYIEFIDSPKFMINTNFIIDADGETNKRRMIELEFSQHYHTHHTPQDEFKHLFFHEWDPDTFNKFDNLMIMCVYVYLKNGLINTSAINRARRLYTQKYDDEMLLFIESLNANENLVGIDIFEKCKQERKGSMPKRWNTKIVYNAIRAAAGISDVISSIDEKIVNGRKCFNITKYLSNINVLGDANDEGSTKGDAEGDAKEPDELF